MAKPADERDSNGSSVVHGAGKSGGAAAHEHRAPARTAPLLTAVDVEAIAEAKARRDGRCPAEDRLEEAMSALGLPVDESFRVFAKRWWRSKRLGLDEDTINDYEWRFRYLERFFGRFRVGEITPRLVDRFRDELHEQSETIRAAQERARTEKGRPALTETVTDRRGRTYQRRRRPLSNTSINAMITLLGQILQQAVDYELIDRNPVRVGGRSARFLKRTRPKRTFLEVDEFRSCSTPPGSSSPKLAKTAKASAVVRCSRLWASQDCGSAS